MGRSKLGEQILIKFAQRALMMGYMGTMLCKPRRLARHGQPAESELLPPGRQAAKHLQALPLEEVADFKAAQPHLSNCAPQQILPHPLFQVAGASLGAHKEEAKCSKNAFLVIGC